MYYMEISRYRDKNHRQYIRTDKYEYSTLDEARKHAIFSINAGMWAGMSAYVSQAFYPSRPLTDFIGGGVKGVSISKTKDRDEFYGAVVLNRGKYYWVLNNPEHKMYLLNEDGTVAKEVVRKPSKKKKDTEMHPFGL